MRKRIRTATFLAALILVLGIYAIDGNVRAATYERHIESEYQRSFSELVTAVEGIDVSLQKGVLSTSPSLLAAICTDIYAKSCEASISLSELPFSTVELENTSGFINRVGDYALSLSRRAASGEAGTDEDHSNLKSLSETASLLSQNLTDLQASIYDGNLKINEIIDTQQQLSQAGASFAAQTSVIGSFRQMETEFPEIPSLIYDGPFSEHIAAKSQKTLEGLPEADFETIRSKAAEFFSLRPEAFEQCGQSEGDVPTICLSAKVDGGEMFVQATRQGGIIYSMFNSRAVPESKLSAEAAVDKASAFLRDNKIENMYMTYYQVMHNVLIANFAARQDGVILYPDLIKVSVALDNGRIVGYEAAGYIANHCARPISEVKLSEAEASSRLSGELTVLAHELAIIPTAGENEVMCHEFKCETPQGQHCLVYVNVETGNEEKILLLLEDESGTLTL
ncbi:MAG: germination protein YpeB [Oscillospiraceae bacterium]|jgi:spore germination protein